MTPPIIGVTAFHTAHPKKKLTYISVTNSYTNALIRSGAVPILIPLGLPEPSLRIILDRVDGVMFTGGGDIEPQRYGGAKHPLVNDVDRERDRVEILLVQSTVQMGKPFFGICRGLQTVNVALGGTLYEDVLEQRPGSMRHACFRTHPRDHLAHTVSITEDSRLAEILGTAETSVNSGHHQAVRDVAPDLQVTGLAPDGVIEALELPGYPFGLSVQWHPEWLMHISSMQALFGAFVNAAAPIGGQNLPLLAQGPAYA